ncbi:MAG: Hsp20/alpha crystallin family protein [Candidatus Cloacimonetes bacterium]|nr:Hsp20/alpha crystallin family protein [Candidatus Cloacimonadota bacterium]
MRFLPTKKLAENASIMPLFDDFLKRFNNLSDDREGNLMAMDIIEREKDYLIKANVPGIRKEDIKISYRERHLTVEASRKEEKNEVNGKIHYSERFSGNYLRTVYIPDNCEYEKIKASLKDGVLELIIPKNEKFTKEIEIQ